MSTENLPAFQIGSNVKLTGAKDLAAALKGTAAETSTNSLPDGGVYISFSGKMGRYSIGTDKEDADPQEAWLLNVHSFEKGYICWKGGSPVAKRLASIYGTPVAMPDFGEHGPFNASNGEGWYPAMALTVRSIDRGIQGYFSTNTKSALNTLADLQEKIGNRIEEGLPCNPLIMLDKEAFTAKGNKNYKPVFPVYGWIGDKQINKMAGMATVKEMAAALDGLINEAEAEGPSTDSTFEEVDGVQEAEVVEDAPEAAEVIPEAEVATKAVEEPAPATPQRRRRAAV